MINNTPAVEMKNLFARTEELCSHSPETNPNMHSELREVVRRTKELAIELLRDNEQLRVQNLLLEKQKIEAEQRLDASRLGKENEQLKSELDLLNQRLAQIEATSKKFRRRYEDIEQHNMALSNVYIASTQLHSTLDFTEVVKTANEILWNLVAAPVFAIFLCDEKSGDLMFVGGEGVEGRFPDGRIHEPTGLIAESLKEGLSLFIDNEVKGDPLACIPLKVEERGVVGIIAVYEIEQHKERLSDLDKELFDLLASQTATAMTSSRVYTETVKKLKSMESFLNLIKPA
jgi:TATA-box binding protein (TBP) (component of TFIID and TFIIIB)